MSEFELYFKLGMEHILDVNGYDHILFVIALSALHLLREWKKVLILVTAFTIGHSITLALSTLNVVNIDPDLIEYLIPVTILITAITNLFKKPGSNISAKRVTLNYFFALFFGLIHGLGFSNYLKSILGRDASIVKQLLAFNLGLEIGQIIIVAFFLLASFIFVNILSVRRRDWAMVISSAIAGISLIMVLGLN